MYFNADPNYWHLLIVFDHLFDYKYSIEYATQRKLHL